jgi:uncharacterized protein YcbK (DUF882 family)
MPASKYFKTAETVCKCGCGTDVQPGFLKRIDELREKVGHSLRLNSAARCQAHNTKVGGAPKSQHLNGIAADVDTLSLTSSQRYGLLKAALELGFCVGVNAAFLHIDIRSGEPIVFTY